MTSAKAIELFSKSEQSISSIAGKDIIAFFGNTGAGKSTAVNYFTRIPLEKKTNRFGDVIVEAV